MALDFRPERAPVELETVDEDGALRIAHRKDRRFALAGCQRQGAARFAARQLRPAHVHLEQEPQPAPPQQPERLQARAGKYANLGPGGHSGIDEKGGGTPGAVAGDLGFASVGIEKANRRVVSGAGFAGPDQNPSVGAGAGVAVADGARGFGQAIARTLVGPGQKKVVLGAVRLRERDSHWFAGKS